MSKVWRTRPSEIYAITGDYRRFCFDNAVMTFGLALEDALEHVEGKTAKAIETKRAALMARWLDQPVKYRNPPSM